MSIELPPTPGAKTSSPASAIRILFVGNSYTAHHDLPALLTQLAASAPRARVVRTRMITAGGASLRRHWNAATVHAALRDASWDIVVLQDQSTLPVKNAARYRDNVGAFIPLIRAHGATPVLYLTWARRDTPQAQPVLNETIVALAREIDAGVAPVGVAWQAARVTCPDIELYVKDGSHPTPAGAYLSACVFLVTLFGIAPTALPAFPARDVDPLVARRLQAVAAGVADWSAAQGLVNPRR
ncbi:MAG: DUF4886 domain-containing protein [Casimicrobiaceae bacterium]